jgi:isocitrate dehydrogenase
MARRPTFAVLPDSCYAGIYQVAIDDCRKNGAYDPDNGSPSTSGLWPRQLRYGSLTKIRDSAAGTVRVVNQAGDPASRGRACRHRARDHDIPIQTGSLAVAPVLPATQPRSGWTKRAPRRQPRWVHNIGSPRHQRSSDRDWRRKQPLLTLERIRRGENTISVTITGKQRPHDLFRSRSSAPAPNASIVPLIAGAAV